MTTASYRFRLNKCSMNSKVPLLLAALLSSTCFAWESAIETMRTGGGVHGLYEIREEARKFVARENSIHGTAFEVLEPNLKVLVPECRAPLQVKWDIERKKWVHSRVLVTCADAGEKSPKKGWTVDVPVYRPPAKK